MDTKSQALNERPWAEWPIDRSRPRGRVLLIEDEAIQALYERQVLEDHGYSVEWAMDGEAAIGLFRRNAEIDIVISDIGLGSTLDGIETARQLEGIRPCPLIFLTSLSREEVEARAQDLDSYLVLAKGGKEHCLMDLIESVLLRQGT